MMQKYFVYFINAETDEEFEIWEMSRPAITHQDFRNMLETMHFYAAYIGRDCEHMVANVLRAGQLAFSILCDTHVDGSRIWMTVYVQRQVEGKLEQPRYVDTMYIAC